MQSKNIAIGAVVLIAVAVGAYLIFNTGLPKRNTVLNPAGDKVEAKYKTYESADYDLSFQYPENYLVIERNAEGERNRKTITLIEDTPANREQMSGVVPGEGPTAITFDVFQNNLDKQDAITFIKNNSASNFKLSNGNLDPGQVGELPAYKYEWDGLYRGQSVVAANDKFVYLMSVTYLEPTDKILSDFYGILNTVSIK